MLALSVSAQGIEVTATVDKNPVMADESFTLKIVANGDLPTDAFDPSPLVKDFVVGRASTSSQTQMKNLTTTRSTSWNTVLIPRKQGRVSIPSINFNGSRTQPISLMVLPVSANAASKNAELFITTSVDVEQAYLQQQIRYTVKLHLAKNLQRGSLSSPKLENADIRQIGKDKEYNEIVDGKRYRIIERSFAIIPQQSGTFTIEGPLFEGEVLDNTRQNFGFFNRSAPVNRVGPNQTINVLPIPSSYPHHWLPSDAVRLDDEWQVNTSGFVAGEPITRTLTLTARGLVEEQLPQINSQYPDQVKTYADQAETTTVEKDQTLIAQRKESIAIIPSKAGRLVIPPVSVPWFNSRTQETEYATLPEKILLILPSPIQAGQPDIAALSLPTPVSASDLTLDLAPVSSSNDPYQFWQGLTGALLIIWFMTILSWRWHIVRLKKALAPITPVLARISLNEQKLWAELEKALNKQNIQGVQSTLCQWLAVLTKQKNGTLESSLVILNNPGLELAITRLLASRYGQQKNQWQSEELHQMLRKLRKQWLTSDRDGATLATLYPSG
jgi:hypothetical protein